MRHASALAALLATPCLASAGTVLVTHANVPATASTCKNSRRSITYFAAKRASAAMSSGNISPRCTNTTFPFASTT